MASREPFQSFCELIRIRNWLVHPKTGAFVDAIYDEQSTISINDTDKEVPWVETLRSGVWPQTRIPLNPFELSDEHAWLALNRLDEMVCELKSVVGKIITDDWLWEIDLVRKADASKARITIDSLWGGYTPKGDDC